LAVTVYPVIVAPPVKEGAVKAMLACASAAVAAPIVGAPGTTALIVNDRVTAVAARKLEFPLWSALTVHVPVVTKVSAPPLVIVQTPVVEDENVGVSPDDAVAVNVGVVPKFWEPGLAKVIV